MNAQEHLQKAEAVEGQVDDEDAREAITRLRCTVGLLLRHISKTADLEDNPPF